MANTPATQYQIPSEAILDVWNKQIYLGNQFISGPDTFSLGDAAEHPLMLFVNPSTNTKALFIFDMNLNAQGTSDVVTFRVYKGATGASGGSPVTPSNLRFASANTSIATVTSSPTATPTTLMQTIVIGFNAQSVVNPLFIVDPGQSIIITGQAASTAVAICQIIHYEL